jgi:D-inositol-3-phosphate glycosyltransferase
MKGRDYTAKKKLFIIADAACDTGFGTVTANLVDHLWTFYEIHILAVNYYGDPHPLQKKVNLYTPTAQIQGDYYGTSRVKPLIKKIKPDVILLINDPWVASQYVPLLEDTIAKKVLYTPIDGTNVKEAFVEPLAAFDHIVCYTEFGKRQLEKHLAADYYVISHGINTKIYRPVNKQEARQRNNFPDDWYIVNVTDRNQIRKRLDLAFFYFAEWARDKPDNIKIHYHGALQDEGWDLIQLAEDFGIKDRVIITSPNITAAHGLPLELMPYVYGVADCGLSVTMGEGWGMTVHERMAMKIPMIVPRYSALGEWANGGVHYAEISDVPYFNVKGLNTRGGIPDKQSTIAALDKIYNDKDYSKSIAEKGYNLATQSKYNWRNIAMQFNDIFKKPALIEEVL